MSRVQPDGMTRAARRHDERRRNWLREGEPSVGRYIAQVGVLGWMIVTPALLLMFLGRWIDHRLGTGIFWTAPLLTLGAALGCYSGWRWMHGR